MSSAACGRDSRASHGKVPMDISSREAWTGAGVTLVAAAIRFYQLAISPWLGRNCRFEPSCSEYTLQSVRKHGAVRGLWRGAGRLLRCHPFHRGGFDPVR